MQECFSTTSHKSYMKCFSVEPQTWSVNCLNIFFQSEAPLLIRPLIQDMTKSELHAVMTGGFATIAGTVLGAYVSMGVRP